MSKSTFPHQLAGDKITLDMRGTMPAPSLSTMPQLPASHTLLLSPHTSKEIWALPVGPGAHVLLLALTQPPSFREACVGHHRLSHGESKIPCCSGLRASSWRGKVFEFERSGVDKRMKQEKQEGGPAERYK